MLKEKDGIIFTIISLLIAEIIIQLSARLISSHGEFFSGNHGNELLYCILVVIIRIFFMTIIIKTVVYWRGIIDKPRFFEVIENNIISIYVSMSTMLLLNIFTLCFY